MTIRWNKTWIGAALLCLVMAACAPADEPARPWFGDLADGPLLLADDGDTAAGLALAAHVAGRLIHPDGAPGIPDRLSRDTAPRIVIVSASNGRRPARVAVGRGRGVAAAVEHACAQLGDAPAAWVKLDVVRRVAVKADHPLGRDLDFDPSLAGVALEREAGVALLPEELTCRGLVRRGGLRVGRVNEYGRFRRAADPRAPAPPTLKDGEKRTVYLFDTRAYFSDGGTPMALFRGHREWRRATAADLLAASKAAGAYLVGAVKADGRFHYVYAPERHEVRPTYNMLRHAGTCYAMMELYDVTRDEALLAAAARAIAWLVRQAKPAHLKGIEASVIVERNAVKLGGNGLALVALARYTSATGDKAHVPLMRRLAAWIGAVQRADGSFISHKQSYPGAVIDAGFRSSYYPGEAMLGLVRLYEHDRQAQWLDVAERAASYLITVRDRGKEIDDLPHDHWLLMALNDLHRLRPQAVYPTHTWRLARAITASQVTKTDVPDWVGGYSLPPRTTPGATRSEGLVAAFHLLSDHGTPEQKRLLPAIRAALDRGIRCQLRFQLRAETAMYFPSPTQALGGFRGGTTSFDIRIDFVQHNLSSILGYRRILLADAP